MLDDLKTWQKAVLGVFAGIAGMFAMGWFLVWLDYKLHPLEKYWDEASYPVDLHFTDKKKPAKDETDTTASDGSDNADDDEHNVVNNADNEESGSEKYEDKVVKALTA